MARGAKAEFDAPEPIVPDGCVEIVLNLGDRFVNADTGEVQPRDLLAGQMTRPVVALPTGAVDLIGIRFRTGRAGAALRLPMWTLQDQLIAASDAVTQLARLADDLGNMAAANRLGYLTTTLCELLQPGDASALSDVDHALSVIDRSHGTAGINEIAGRVGKTPRQLERRFRDHVGLGAKQVARITRVHAVLQLLTLQPSMSGAEIAAACGYSDQAHMIRECRDLTGQTPSRLRTTSRSLAAWLREGSVISRGADADR